MTGRLNSHAKQQATELLRAAAKEIRAGSRQLGKKVTMSMQVRHVGREKGRQTLNKCNRVRVRLMESSMRKQKKTGQREQGKSRGRRDSCRPAKTRGWGSVKGRAKLAGAQTLVGDSWDRHSSNRRYVKSGHVDCWPERQWAGKVQGFGITRDSCTGVSRSSQPALRRAAARHRYRRALIPHSSLLSWR